MAANLEPAFTENLQILAYFYIFTVTLIVGKKPRF